MRYNKRYMHRILKDPLPPLEEDQRIYLNVPFMARDFAKHAHCGFDTDKKLWFAGPHNANLRSLVELYGVNEATSKKALQLLKEKLESESNE